MYGFTSSSSPNCRENAMWPSSVRPVLRNTTTPYYSPSGVSGCVLVVLWQSCFEAYLGYSFIYIVKHGVTQGRRKIHTADFSAKCWMQGVDRNMRERSSVGDSHLVVQKYRKWKSTV